MSRIIFPTEFLGTAGEDTILTLRVLMRTNPEGFVQHADAFLEGARHVVGFMDQVGKEFGEEGRQGAKALLALLLRLEENFKAYAERQMEQKREGD